MYGLNSTCGVCAYVCIYIYAQGVKVGELENMADTILQEEIKPLTTSRFLAELGLSFGDSHRMHGRMDHHGDGVDMCM